MGLTGPGYTTQQPQPKKRPAWVVGGVTIVTFVALLWIIEVIDQVSGNRLDAYGIRPLELDGLWGIIWAPLLHYGWPHLWANTLAALPLGFLLTLTGIGRFFSSTAIIWIVGGFGTWLIGEWPTHCGTNVNVIGASGVIFGWLAFLIVFGFFNRNVWQILVGIVVLFIYGGYLWGALPTASCTGISWQGHLAGAVAGVLAAYLLSGPERKAREQRKRKAANPYLTS